MSSCLQCTGAYFFELLSDIQWHTWKSVQTRSTPYYINPNRQFSCHRLPMIYPSPLAVAESILYWKLMLIHSTLGASYVVGRYSRAQLTLCCWQMLLTLPNPTLWESNYKPGKSFVFGSPVWHTFEPVNHLSWSKLSKPGHHSCKHSLSLQFFCQVQAIYLKY